MKKPVDYTMEQCQALNDYLVEVVKNCSMCKECCFRHEFSDEVFCFFAFDCLQNNFSFFKENA